MKVKLDNELRKYIEIDIEIDGENKKLKYFEKNTKQIKELKKLTKKQDTKVYEVEELSEKQFFDNLKGEKETIDYIVNFYEENGNFYDFINQCDEVLGKQKKRG